MKKSLAILAVAGMATAASAQGWSFSLQGGIGEVGNELRLGQDTATVILSAGFPTDDYAMAGARVDVHASEGGWNNLSLLAVQLPKVAVPPPYPDPQGRTPGVADGSGNVTGAVFGQLHIGPFVANPENPLPVWQGDFTVTDFTAREISLSTTTGEFRVYPDVGSPMSAARTVDEGSGSIFVIPAPASLALLGLGGLAVARRRR